MRAAITGAHPVKFFAKNSRAIESMRANTESEVAMSHESVQPGRGVVYTVPASFRDVLRAQEFSEFFLEYQASCFSVQTLDGWSWSSSPGIPALFTAIFESRAVLDDVIDDASEATLRRLFLEGGLEISGNTGVLLSVAQFTIRNSGCLSHSLIQSITRLTHHFSRKLVPVQHNSDSQNWHFSPCPLHLPSSFFEPWLGSDLGHSCSRFETDSEDLEAAQGRALRLACEWLEMDPRDWFLDVACGWGSLLTHAGKLHGVHAQGIVSSDQQSHSTSERIRKSGLNRLCAVEHRDLRFKPFHSGAFDKIAHLGIFEQVGGPDFAGFLRCIRHMLVPGGLILMHRMTNSAETGKGITMLPPEFLSNGISRELELSEKSGFDLVRVEDIGAEYEFTLRIWIDRLLKARHSSTMRPFSYGCRIWMLYLVEVLTCLDVGEAQVHRVLLRRKV